MNWQYWLLIAIIIGALIGGIFIGKGCNEKPETVVIQQNTPAQDSLFKAMDMLREIIDKQDSSRTTKINNIENEIIYYSNFPDSVLHGINIELADSLIGKHRYLKQRTTP